MLSFQFPQYFFFFFKIFNIFISVYISYKNPLVNYQCCRLCAKIFKEFVHLLRFLKFENFAHLKSQHLTQIYWLLVKSCIINFEILSSWWLQLIHAVQKILLTVCQAEHVTQEPHCFPAHNLILLHSVIDADLLL